MITDQEIAALNLPEFPTSHTVAQALEAAIDIEKLNGDERNNIIIMVLEAFRDGHVRGCGTISAGWRKSNEERSRELQKRYAIS